MADPSLYEPMPSVARSDLLDLAPHSIVTSEAPRSQISASEIEQPYREMAGALDKWASATNEVGDYFAERQAQTDLAKQRVTRDANGNIQVLNPANSVFFGDAGFKYANAVRAGTAMQAANVMSQMMTEQHIRNPMDAQAFQKGSDALIDKFSQQYGSSPWAGPVIAHGRQLQTEHYDRIASAAASNDIEQQKKSILDNIEDQKNTMIGLARQQGTGSNEFKQAMTKYTAAQQALAANPLFKTPKATIDLDIKNTTAKMQSEALVAHVDDTYNKKGKAEAQQILEKEVLNNPDLKETDRGRLYSQGMSRLAFLTSDEKAGFEADKQSLGYARKALAEGKITPDGPEIKGLYEQFQKNHSTEAIAQLDAILKVHPVINATRQSPDSERQPAAQPASAPSGMSPAGGPWVKTPTGFYGTDKDGNIQPNMKAPDVRHVTVNERGEVAGGGNAVDLVTRELTSRGVSPEVAKGALAGLMGESGKRLDPTSFNTKDPGGGSGGIGQWNRDRLVGPNGLLAFAARNGVQGLDINEPQDAKKVPIDIQAKFVGHELDTTHHGVLVGLLSVRTGEEGLTTWVNNYENPADKAGAIAQRMQYVHGGGGGGNYPTSSANGRPAFTAADYASNPFLLDEQLRAIAEDPEDRVSHYSATVDAMEKTVAGGNLAPTDDLAGAIQAGQNAPPGSALSLLGARAEGIMVAQMAMAGPGGGPMPAPQRQAFEQQIEAKINGSDLYHQKLAETALQLLREQDQHARDAPLTAYAQRFGLPAPPPIDAGHPEDVASAIAARGVLAQHIGALNQSEAPPILEKGDAQKLQGALMGQQGAQVIQGIMSSTRPEDLQRLTDEPAFRESVLAMARSTDPAKLNAGNSALDTLAKLNPRDFESKFGKEAITQLAYWQNNLAFKNPDEQAKAMQKANDPDQAAARAELTKVADKALEAVSPDNVVSKFSTGSFASIFGPGAGSGALPPQGAAGDVDAKQQLWVDYRNLYREAFAQTGDAKTADSAAMSRLSVKYGVSQLNGGRVTAYPPENYYPDVNGSKAWMAKQLDDEVAKAIGYTPRTQAFGPPETGQEQAAAREFAAPRALLADTQTQRDLAAGRSPSYQVIIQGQNGFTALPDARGQPRRFFFEPPYADQIERMEQMRAGRIPAAPFRSGGYQAPLQIPDYQLNVPPSRFREQTFGGQ